MTMKEMLQENKLSTLHLKTASNWLLTLGFKCSDRKEDYYNEKHKSKENVSYHKKFIKRYFN